MQPNKTRADLWMDLPLVAFLIAFDVAARLLPHAPGFWPFAASALFAGRMLRIPALAVAVPLVRCAREQCRARRRRLAHHAVVFAADRAARLGRHRWRAAGTARFLWCGDGVVLADLLPRDEFRGLGLQRHVSDELAGPTQCYVAALPFLDKTVMGDLFWTAVLFGGAWLVQNGPALARRAH